jgi:hypothetical protein
MKENTPKGYMRNSKGGLDPVELVKDIDKMRDALVKGIVTQTMRTSKDLKELKKQMVNDIKSFVARSAKKYGVKLGGQKGNMSFLSYDGEYKVTVAASENIVFDERLHVAKKLIDECIKGWTKGAASELQVLVSDAFYVGKEGKINTQRILGLRRLNINDPKWKKAMDAISESVQISGSKSYLRVYHRNTSGEYDLINLDIAAL